MALPKWAWIALGTLAIVAGALDAAFFTLLLFVADCSEACQARGERIPAYLLIALGLAAAAFGAWMIARGVRARAR